MLPEIGLVVMTQGLGRVAAPYSTRQNQLTPLAFSFRYHIPGHLPHPSTHVFPFKINTPQK
jgi:hypothetical protein